MRWAPGPGAVGELRGNPVPRISQAMSEVHWTFTTALFFISYSAQSPLLVFGERASAQVSTHLRQ